MGEVSGGGGESMFGRKSENSLRNMRSRSAKEFLSVCAPRSLFFTDPHLRLSPSLSVLCLPLSLSLTLPATLNVAATVTTLYEHAPIGIDLSEPAF